MHSSIRYVNAILLKFFTLWQVRWYNVAESCHPDGGSSCVEVLHYGHVTLALNTCHQHPYAQLKARYDCHLRLGRHWSC